MNFQSSPPLRRVAGAFALALLAACGGGDKPGAESGATADEVDASEPAEVTEQERAAFTAPADSVLTPEQVDKYLRVSLLQFDYLNKEAPALYAKANELSERAEKNNGENAVASLRDFADAMGWIGEWGNLVGGSFVRSARSLDMNPAEMEWVRDRMAEVSIQLMFKPMADMAAEFPKMQRQMAESMRGMVSDEEYRKMLAEADSAEAAMKAEAASGALARNVEVLRRAKPAVTDEMWGAIAMAGGATGLAGLGGLGDPNDTTAQRQLTEWRQIYTDALANRVTKGYESKKAGEQPAAPAGTTPADTAGA